MEHHDLDVRTMHHCIFYTADNAALITPYTGFSRQAFKDCYDFNHGFYSFLRRLFRFFFFSREELRIHIETGKHLCS